MTMKMTDRIHAKLTAAFAPDVLDIVDDSESHRGHGGFREGGETHFNVAIVSDAFIGQSRVARQRAVYDALAEEMSGSIHALSLRTQTRAEAGIDADPPAAT